MVAGNSTGSVEAVAAEVGTTAGIDTVLAVVSAVDYYCSCYCCNCRCSFDFVGCCSVVFVVTADLTSIGCCCHVVVGYSSVFEPLAEWSLEQRPQQPRSKRFFRPLNRS